MAKRKKKRSRSPHPGIVLIEKSPGRWVARCDLGPDPATGKRRRRDVTLCGTADSLGLNSAEARTEWARAEAGKLLTARTNARRLAVPEFTEDTLAEGNPDAGLEPSTLADAFETYFRDARKRLRQTTLDAYEAATDELTEWAESEGIATVAELDGAALRRFREAARVKPRMVQLRAAGKRGERVPDPNGTAREPRTVNRILRSVGTVLEDLRSRGVVPLSRDEIRDGTKPTKAPRSLPRFLRADECKALMQALLRHDTKCFALTRAEKAAGVEPGNTPRYSPIAPFTLAALLTGCRVGELMELEWGMVRLDLDADGQPDGILDLTPSLTKTDIGREVELRISPSVQHLLASLKLKAGKNRYVFGGTKPLARHLIENARKRLQRDFNAPPFGWHDLRRTCGTFMTNAEGLFGASVAPYASAQRLGHSVDVAIRSYVGRVRSIPKTAATLEAAMGIEPETAKVLAMLRGERVALESEPPQPNETARTSPTKERDIND